MSLITEKPFNLDDELTRLDPAERDAATAFLAAHAAGAGAPLAIVIPAYNEEPTVADVVAEIPSEAAGLQTEVIVVVDGAKDAHRRRGDPRGSARLRCPRQPWPGRGAAARLLAGSSPRRAGHLHDRRRWSVRAGGDRPGRAADP